MNNEIDPTPREPAPGTQDAATNGVGPKTRVALDQPNWGPLHRLRPLILILAGLGCAEWIFLRFGLVSMLASVAIFLGAWLFFAVARDTSRARRALILNLGLVVAVTGALHAVYGPMIATAGACMAGLIFVVVVWRLKLRHLMVLVACVAIGLSVAMRLRSSALFLMICLVVPVVIASIYVTFLRKPAIEQDALVSILAMTTRAGLPLGPAVEAFAGMCGARFQRRLQVLASLFRSQANLPSAIDRAPTVLPAESAMLARLGFSLGTLAPTLEQAVLSRKLHNEMRPNTKGIIAYPLIVAAVTCFSMLVFVFSIFPRLSAIASDFGVQLRGPTAWLVSEANALAAEVVYFADEHLLESSLVVAVGLLALGVTAWAMWKHGAFCPTFGVWLARRRETAALLRGLSVAIEAGHPLPSSILEILRSGVSRFSARRWSRAFDSIKRGSDLAVALRGSRLVGRSEKVILECAQRVGNLPWVLRTCAERIERRGAARVRWIGHLLHFGSILLLGAFVALVCLSYFYPLVLLISQTAEAL